MGLDQAIASRAPGPLFSAAAREVLESVADVVAATPRFRKARVFERLLEPDRVVRFRVEWMDDSGDVHVNRGWRVEHSNLLGPYKGGLRLHPSVTEDVLAFLAYEQCFKNALTGLPLGGGKGGSDFDPKGRSDAEVMRFCQSFMMELSRHIGARTDVPAGDIGVGGREIGFLAGAYARIANRRDGVLTGKPEALGGLAGRSEATGYGLVAFVRAMLEHAGESLEGKRVAISGSGNVSMHAAERATEFGATVVALSDSGGTLACEQGFDAELIEQIKAHKFERRGRLIEIDAKGCQYFEKSAPWRHVLCDVALPCATQHELDADDARWLIDKDVRAVGEGANMPCTPDARKAFIDDGVLYGPGKAANAGGVAASGFEMSQNAGIVPWTKKRTVDTLEDTMRAIHDRCVEHGAGEGPVNYARGADVAGFVLLADAMIASGVG